MKAWSLTPEHYLRFLSIPYSTAMRSEVFAGLVMSNGLLLSVRAMNYVDACRESRASSTFNAISRVQLWHTDCKCSQGRSLQKTKYAPTVQAPSSQKLPITPAVARIMVISHLWPVSRSTKALELGSDVQLSIPFRSKWWSKAISMLHTAAPFCSRQLRSFSTFTFLGSDSGAHLLGIKRLLQQLKQSRISFLPTLQPVNRA